MLLNVISLLYSIKQSDSHIIYIFSLE